MLSAPDFVKKQIIFVFFNEGEKMSFSNDNIVIRTSENKIKFQCTCYRLFILFAVGHTSITTALIQKARKFGFFIALMTPGFRLYDIIGASKEGNTLLRKKQYMYAEIDIAKHIIVNKINNQKQALKRNRGKEDSVKEAIVYLSEYEKKALQATEWQELLAYEGLASKSFFQSHFDNIVWKGRQPRIKRDYVNSVLDIGYTLLFTFVDALLESYGFDTYCGVLHKEFYMRKSLVCDMVEPFRVLIDWKIKKAINLNQIKKEDFIVIQGQYRLKWECSPKYVAFLLQPIMENKESIFLYIQNYYRAFMKGVPAGEYPIFNFVEDCK